MSKYTDQSIQQMVVNSLADDGVICNFYNKYYDEQETYKGGTGSRLAFKGYNDKIIKYHSLLKVLTGEQRADIHETIPVIDYTDPTISPFMYAYEETGDKQYPIDPTTIVPINMSAKEDALELLEDDDPYTINRAVMGYPVAEHFYNTTGLVSSDYNIQVSPYDSDFTYQYNGVKTSNVIVNGEISQGLRRTNILIYELNHSIDVEFNVKDVSISSSESKEIKDFKYAVDEMGNIILNTDAGYVPSFTVDSGIKFGDKTLITKVSDYNYTLSLSVGDVMVAIPSASYSSDANKLLIFKSSQNAESETTQLTAIEGYKVDDDFYTDDTLSELITPTLDDYYLDMYSKEKNNLTYYKYNGESYIEASVTTDDPSGLIITVSTPISKYTCYVLYISNFNSGLSVASSFEEVESGSELNITSKYLISAMQDYLNIETVYSANASGLLDGYYCEPLEYTEGTDARKITKWKFLDDTATASEYGVTIDIGSKYFSGHLLGRGTILDEPLKLTEHDSLTVDGTTYYAACSGSTPTLESININGKTSLIYKKIINSDIINHIFEDAEVDNWADFTSHKVSSVVTKLDYAGSNTTTNDIIDLSTTTDTTTSKMTYKAKFYKNGESITFDDILTYISRFRDMLSDGVLKLDSRYDYILSSRTLKRTSGLFRLGNQIVLTDGSEDHKNNIQKVRTSLDYIAAYHYDTLLNNTERKVLYYTLNLSYELITPRELFFKNNEDSDVVIVSPEYNKYFPENVILLSKYDLKLEPYGESTRGICSFLTPSDDGNDHLLVFKVDQVIPLIFKGLKNISVYDPIYGKTELYMGGRLWYGERDCYIYILSPVSVSITDDIEIYDHNDELMKIPSYDSCVVGTTYPDNYFPIETTTDSDGTKHYIIPQSNRYTDYKILEQATIIPGLPKFDDPSELESITKDGYSLRAFAKLLSDESNAGRSIKSVSKTLLNNIISQWPVSDSSTNPILMKDMPGLLAGIKEFNNDITSFSESSFNIISDGELQTLDKSQLTGLIDRISSDTVINNHEYVINNVSSSIVMPESLKEIIINKGTTSQEFKDGFADFLKDRLDLITLEIKNTGTTTTRSSITKLYNIFNTIFGNDSILSFEDCQNLDKYLGTGTKAFIGIGNSNNISTQVNAKMEEFYNVISDVTRSTINEVAAYNQIPQTQKALSNLRTVYASYYTVESVNEAVILINGELHIDTSKLVIDYSSTVSRTILEQVKNEDDPYNKKWAIGKLFTLIFNRDTIWNRYSLDDFIYKFITSKSDSDSTKQLILSCFSKRIALALFIAQTIYHKEIETAVATTDQINEYYDDKILFEADSGNKYKWTISVPTIAINSLHKIFMLDTEITSSDSVNRIYDYIDVEESVLRGLVEFIKTALEGTNPNNEGNDYYVKYVAGEDDEPTGRPNSLYYKRYQMLNNRMNRLQGPLWLAATYIRNSSVFEDSYKFSQEVTDSFDRFMTIMPVSSMDALTYMPAQNATTTTIELPGKFYSDKELQALANQINNVCVLTCTTCSIRDNCPFYDQNEVIKMYCTGTETIDLWVKDNKLDLIDEDSINLTKNPNDGFSPDSLKQKHLMYSDIVRKKIGSDYDTRNVNDLEDLRTKLKSQYAQNYTKYVKDDLGFLLKARYGTVSRNSIKSLIESDNEYYKDKDKIHPYKFLYDALYIPDEETYVNYTPSNNSYKFSFDIDNQLYEGTTKIQIPVSLKLIADANDNDDVYLVSDDTQDSDGNEIIPVIYLGQASKIQWIFDLQDDGVEGGIKSSDDTKLYAADVAQWCMNYYKGSCMKNPLDEEVDGITDNYTNKDQYWMETIYKWINSDDNKTDGKWIQLSGRSRASADYNEPLIDPDNFDDIQAVSGRPMTANYINFIRRVSIRMYDSSTGTWTIPWIKEGMMLPTDKFGSDIESQREFQRSVLPLMKTNLRLALVKAEQQK